jgi:DUF1680 family protein
LDAAVQVTTDYPWDGRITVNVTRGGQWGLKLRVPSWASGATVRINGGEPKTVTLNAAGETVLELTLAGRSATSVTVTR